MCILCVVQKWSRKLSTMLPWLVLPLVLLWAFSQFLPPSFRFEITSPRLACVLVLLVTLFWYEILMPQLSLWRSRRSARLREMHRNQALELQKLRKTATRRCRNCLTAYRDQNPGGGKFMCTYCGHISKRPVLDLPAKIKSSGIIDSLVGKNGWICSQDWSLVSNVNWGWGGPVHRYRIGDEHFTEKSYYGALPFACKLLSSFFLYLKWLCMRLFWFSSRDNGSDADNRASVSERGENECSLQESRGEKAKRKAEEKRQARLEKEMLEEEERKQREEVARLVEERRKLRDEKLEAERLRSKCRIPDGEMDRRKEAEKKRHDKKKDKDKGSNKSNSDGEDFEKKSSRESEKKRDCDKKNENERRDTVKTSAESNRSHNSEALNRNRNVTSKPRYFGRMTNSFLSSSRGFTGASLFGRNTHNSATHAIKASKPVAGFVDHGSVHRRGSQAAVSIVSKPTPISDDKMSGINLSQPVGQNAHLQPAAPKKSWHQLFTRSAAVSPDPPAASGYQSHNAQLGIQSANLTNQNMFPKKSFDNKFNLNGHHSFNVFPPVIGTFGTFNSRPLSHLPAESLLPSVKDPVLSSVQEEPELFEDPCYIPDPLSLLGPVSESLDNFPLDLGTGFVSSDEIEQSRVLKNVSAPREISKPSPIESPMSKMRVSEEKQNVFGQFPGPPLSQESKYVKLEEPSNTQGMWQMWGTPIAHDALGLGGPASWLPSIGHSNLELVDNIHPLVDSSTSPPVAPENHVLPTSLSPRHIYTGNQMNGGIYSSPSPGMISDTWKQNASLQTLPNDRESLLLPQSLVGNQSTKVAYESHTKSKDGSPFELCRPNCWSNKHWAVDDTQEPGSSIPAAPHFGGLFSSGPDVQSVWSFSRKETI